VCTNELLVFHFIPNFEVALALCLCSRVAIVEYAKISCLGNDQHIQTIFIAPSVLGGQFGHTEKQSKEQSG
jgi:hypothetical protein